MKNQYVIITALENELSSSSIPNGIPVIYSGIGKVNATMATMKAIQEHQASFILNFGTVGKINSDLSGLVEVSKVIQRDMMAEPLAPRGQVPFCSKAYEHFSGRGDVVCGSGDSFVTSQDLWLQNQNVDVVDMELFAIAAVAAEYQLPWRSFKYITDEANESSGDDWMSKVRLGEALFLKELNELLSSESL